MARRRKHRIRPARLGPVDGANRADVPTIEGLPPKDRYRDFHERFGRIPGSVWETSHRMSLEQRRLRALVGDVGQSRIETVHSGVAGGFNPDAPPSVFNPELAGLLVTAYTAPGEYIVDPFAGGGTRAVIATALGRTYFGIDVRAPEVDRVNGRLEELGLHTEADVVVGSSTDRSVWPTDPDALITCPPYWNLEVYSDDPMDLSTAPTYTAFLSSISDVVEHSFSVLREGALSVWVVGDIRHRKTGELLDFPGDLTRIHQEAGFFLYDKVIYRNASPFGASLRSGIFDKTRRTVRQHEYVLVFSRGQGRRLPIVGSL